MSIKNVMAVAFGALLSASAMSALAHDPKTSHEDGHACCTSAGAKHASGKMRCSLTGKTVETCCCVEKEGRLHCTLAGKDVESCCCKPVDESDKTDEGDDTEQADRTTDTSRE